MENTVPTRTSGADWTESKLCEEMSSGLPLLQAMLQTLPPHEQERTLQHWARVAEQAIATGADVTDAEYEGAKDRIFRAVHGMQDD